jgi:hypothetical protein
MTPVLSLWRAGLRKLVLLWWRQALKEMGPLHPDLPIVVRRINELETRR